MCAQCGFELAEELWEIGRSLDEIADIFFQKADKRADRYRLQAEQSRELAREIYPDIDLILDCDLEQEQEAHARNNS